MTNGRRYSKWVVPALSVAIGAAMLAAQWANGHRRTGLESLAIMLVAGGIFVFGGRSETIRGLRGDGRDERFQSMDILSTAFAGAVVIAVLIVAFIVELARGHDGMPYAWLGAVAGLAYLVAVAWQRLRR
jgi:drug/metabolite transporter (DMT)-like permease